MTRNVMRVLLACLSALQLGAAPQAPAGADSAACVTDALERTALPDNEAMLLCEFARNTEPVDCYLKLSEETFLQETDILRACQATLQSPRTAY